MIIWAQMDVSVESALAIGRQPQALCQLGAANRDLGLLHGNPNHLALLGNKPLVMGEFYHFILACKIYGLAKDLTDMCEERKELFEFPPVLPNLLDYYGDVLIVSDSTLETRKGATKVGHHGPESDFASTFGKATCGETGARPTRR